MDFSPKAVTVLNILDLKHGFFFKCVFHQLHWYESFKRLKYVAANSMHHKVNKYELILYRTSRDSILSL